MTAKKAEQTELVVNYSIGVKANLGNYESGDVHLSKTEKWNVEGLTQAQISALYEDRHLVLHDELGAKIEEEYEELITGRKRK